MVAVVKLSMMINYSGDFHADVRTVQALEAAGLDLVWVPEAYSFDSVSQMGYLAAKTEHDRDRRRASSTCSPAPPPASPRPRPGSTT